MWNTHRDGRWGFVYIYTLTPSYMMVSARNSINNVLVFDDSTSVCCFFVRLNYNSFVRRARGCRTKKHHQINQICWYQTYTVWVNCGVLLYKKPPLRIKPTPSAHLSLPPLWCLMSFHSIIELTITHHHTARPNRHSTLARRNARWRWGTYRFCIPINPYMVSPSA